MDDRTDLAALAVETARKHPLAVAAWLVADAVLNAAITVQEAIEDTLRPGARPEVPPRM
jgi:hypothetical protein